MESEINDVSEKVKEYADLSKTIRVTQEKLKLLNKKKKLLYKEVMPKLKTNNVTKCNLPYGTLKMVKTKRKVMPNKATMKEKYALFFNTRANDEEYARATPEEKSEMLYSYIYIDNIEFKEEQTISMTYSKEFLGKFKEMAI
jgi:hypothetical protein